ncbi:hypothetical protein QUF61_15720 [Candidatus Venteria ishoeyi]|uniref:hypothetical protein n=1 Tax=Candidatus Venteria ishoeyi TaxID=1899563 RepID=UPI0025A64EEF|nr:hypothetical protein [Candidatus Venteria ishoeyi]MDM8547936.1 hypothetical protein [Candidatus Venteria ishoeyi]
MKLFILDYLHYFWLLLTAMAPYLLLALLLTGFIKVGLATSWRKKAGQYFSLDNALFHLAWVLISYGVFGMLFTLYCLFSVVLIKLLSRFFIPVLHNETVVVASKKPLSAIPIKVLNPQSEQNGIDRVRQITDYAFNVSLKSLARALLFSLVFGAAMLSLPPVEVAKVNAILVLHYVLLCLIAMMFSISAITAVVMAMVLSALGFSAGGIFIFLLTAISLNFGNKNMLFQHLKQALWWQHVLLVCMLGMVLAALFDGFMPDYPLLRYFHLEAQQNLGFIAQVCAVIVLYLSVKFLWNKKAKISAACNGL